MTMTSRARRPRHPILALVVPCYNEQEVLPETSRRMVALLEDLVDAEPRPQLVEFRLAHGRENYRNTETAGLGGGSEDDPPPRLNRVQQ